MKIAVISGKDKDIGFELTQKICDRLAQFDAEILLAVQARPYIRGAGTEFLDEPELFAQADLMIVIGGDGAILHAANSALPRQTPLLGINRGRLGFMAGLEIDELDRLADIFAGAYELDSRMMLEITLSQGRQYFALNDAVVSKGGLTGLIDLDISCNNRPVGSYRADGIILSTPTGSTAYALSAGGPVVDPGLACIAVTPICPHSLMSRSILFAPDSVIAVEPCTTNRREAYLSVDGQNTMRLAPGETVRITRSKRSTRLVKLKDNSFYEVLNQKMNERGI